MIVNILLIIFILEIVGVLLPDVRYTSKTAQPYSKSVTDSLKGIMVIGIMFAHICQAVPALKESLWGRGWMYQFVFSWGAVGVAVFYFLSGYFSWISLYRTCNPVRWFAKCAIKSFTIFATCFFFTSLVLLFMTDYTLSLYDYIYSFFTLGLPGLTTWYFKVQLLLYLLLAISTRIKKSQSVVICVLVLIYAGMARMLGMRDYWWKTSLCFAAGCMVAQYRVILLQYVKKGWVLGVLLVLGSISFIYVQMDYRYILIPQLVAYILMAMCIFVVWNSAGHVNRFFDLIGKAS